MSFLHRVSRTCRSVQAKIKCEFNRPRVDKFPQPPPPHPRRRPPPQSEWSKMTQEEGWRSIRDNLMMIQLGYNIYIDRDRYDPWWSWHEKEYQHNPPSVMGKEVRPEGVCGRIVQLVKELEGSRVDDDEEEDDDDDEDEDEDDWFW